MPVIVLVQVLGGPPFTAEIELDVNKVDPANMPHHLKGFFSRLPSSSEGGDLYATFLLQSHSTGGDGAQHTMWFHGNRTGYQFRMVSESTLEFTATKL
jgi:hypothetical protein